MLWTRDTHLAFSTPKTCLGNLVAVALRFALKLIEIFPTVTFDAFLLIDTEMVASVRVVLCDGHGFEGLVASDVATGDVRRGSLDGRGSEGPATGGVAMSLYRRGREGLAAADLRTSRRLDRRGEEGPALVISVKQM